MKSLALFAVSAFSMSLLAQPTPLPGRPLKVLELGHSSDHHNTIQFYPLMAEPMARQNILVSLVLTPEEALRPDVLEWRGHGQAEARTTHAFMGSRSVLGRGSSTPTVGHRVIMRRDAQGDFDGRNRHHGKEENQRIGRHILPAIKKLAEWAIVGIVVAGRVFPGRCLRRAGFRQGGGIGRDMDVGLGGVALQQESEQHKAGENETAQRPSGHSFTGQCGLHLSFTRAKDTGAKYNRPHPVSRICRFRIAPHRDFAAGFLKLEG